MAPGPFSQGDSQLIAHLHSLHKKSPKLVKPVQHVAPAAPEITVESWKMNEFKYYDIPSPFPTLARGLFSVEEKGEKDGQSRYRIVARGYDKFFNIGEVPWTTVRSSFPPTSPICFLTFLSFHKWSSLETHTKPPYTLTLKSNGCIIFIAALSSSKLLVTSKHSIGPLQGIPESHAQAGERWLRHHLEQVDKTTEQLAEVLWEKNWTAVAEVSCPFSCADHHSLTTRSSAMMVSRSMSFPTPPRRRVCIYMVSTIAPGTSRPSQLPWSTSSRASGGSSSPCLTSYHL
jgi:tRNA ligase